MKAVLLRLGMKVKTRDLRSVEHERVPDRREDVGKVVDYYRKYGRNEKDKSPPYLIEFLDGERTWFDADEVERVTRLVK